MINKFDFYSVELFSDSIKSLKGVGIDRDKIESYNDGYKQYGRNSYPIKRYKSTVAIIDLMTNTKVEIEKQIQKLQQKYGKFDGIRVSVKYFARD